MTNPLLKKHIVLGVTGSIAAYKAVELASALTQAGALVDVILTPSAEKFVAPITFSSVTGRGAYVEADLWGGQGHVLHIGLGRTADLIVIAPATANIMAKLAHGIADNLLSVTTLAADCPMIIAPAMDAGMFSREATQENVEILQKRGVIFVGPEEGHLASGLMGKGRLSDLSEVIGTIRHVLAQGGPLTGKKIVVTAGGTQEPIDPVRMITNRSSGKQGFAIAQAAVDQGAQVILIAAPTQLPTPVGAQRIDVQTADEMLEKVLAETANADGLIMAAAVSDFKPARAVEQKIKKTDGIPELALQRTPDILANVATQKQTRMHPKVVVGFAAESNDLLKNAQAKLMAKRLDFIVANDISDKDAGFEVDSNRITVLYANGQQEFFPLMSKTEVAVIVIERVISLLSPEKK
jgi:phosphopantothenoylcysteine decarboxylase/phosphopantothenate--cysteine ligase